MALFTHRKSNEPDEAEREASLRVPQTIGSILRASRQQSGKSIADAAAALRIRPAFLSAIEEDEPERLPGPAYAVGFVRTYAEYLGLDGEAVARRFKQDIAGLEARQDFSFPVALPERSRPGGAILLVALIVGACAYGLWYYRTSGEREHPERVAAVPADLMPQKIATPAVAAPAPASATAAAAAAAPGGEAATAAMPTPQPATTSEASPVAAAAVSEPANPPASAPAAATGSATAPAAEPLASETAAATASAPAAAQVAALPPPPPPPATEAAHGAASSETATTAAKPEPGRVYGVTNGPVRIVLRAAGGDSWIQVKDGTQTVSMRVLRQGESYRVPDRSGLTLITGNAGALEVTVDGHPAPSVGPLGRKRIVALDPERLVKGTADLD